MFEFHDETQPARIQQFVLNLKNLKIPPRLAPDFSFKMGYPLFNFYAPFSYWITGFINLLGFNVVNSLKISFLLALTTAFIAAFVFLNLLFDFYPSLFGATAYITSFYFPVDIFVRGNLAEVWFLALFPLATLFLYKNVQKKSSTIFFLTVLAVSFVLSVHNILSLIFIPISLVYIFILKKNIKLNLFAFFLALLLASYFILPSILEINLIHAKQVASSSDFRLHFLCPLQLWQSNWGYGGSTEGCLNDGMSFKVGKIQLIFAFLGLVLFLIKRNKKVENNLVLFFIFLTLISLFLTTYQSQFIWEAFSKIFSLFQFPWRFIAFSLLGISFLVSFFWQNFKIKFKSWFIFFFILYLIFYSSKYFVGQSISKKEFEKKYLSASYIEKKVAYKVAEYLPRIVNYQHWRKFNSEERNFIHLNFNYQLPAETADNNLIVLKNTFWRKELSINRPGTVILNIHYFPFWKIVVNGKEIVPQQFDLLGRPIIDIKKQSGITLTYEQTILEKLGNSLTILSLGVLAIIVINKKIWKRILTYFT